MDVPFPRAACRFLMSFFTLKISICGQLKDKIREEKVSREMQCGIPEMGADEIDSAMHDKGQEVGHCQTPKCVCERASFYGTDENQHENDQSIKCLTCCSVSSF